MKFTPEQMNFSINLFTNSLTLYGYNLREIKKTFVSCNSLTVVTYETCENLRNHLTVKNDFKNSRKFSTFVFSFNPNEFLFMDSFEKESEALEYHSELSQKASMENELIVDSHDPMQFILTGNSIGGS